MSRLFLFFPQTEIVIHALVIKTSLFMHFHESITLRKEILLLHPTSYNQSLPFVLLSITHHVLTPSVSSRSLPLGLTRTSPSPSRLGAHPCILFLPLSPFIHLSIFQLLYIERSPLLLLWVVGLALNFVIFAFQILYIYFVFTH